MSCEVMVTVTGGETAIQIFFMDLEPWHFSILSTEAGEKLINFGQRMA
jgi:hypothetical protein